MPKVVVSIPELGVRPGGWEKNKEIYTIAFAADLRGEENREQSFIAGYNETLPNLVPQVATADLLNWVVVSASNLFERIRPDQPASLSGSGILLYPNLDPKGLLALHVAVIESDAGTRDLGRILEAVTQNDEAKDLMAQLSNAVTQPLLGALMNAMIGQIPKLLRKNKDDLLFAHNHSGFDFDNYGADADAAFTDYSVGNDRAYCRLRVRVGD